MEWMWVQLVHSINIHASWFKPPQCALRVLVGALGTREGDKTLHSCPKMTPTGNAKRWISARIIWSNPFSLTETVILTLFVYLIPNIGRKRHGPAFMSNSYLPARHVTKRPYFDESPVTEPVMKHILPLTYYFIWSKIAFCFIEFNFMYLTKLYKCSSDAERKLFC